MLIKSYLPLYFIAGTQDCRIHAGNPAENLLCILRQALESGITCFQFRDKGAFSLENQPEKQHALALACRDLCRTYNVPFIVNDNVKLAFELEADGIHVGQSDTPVTEIRQKAKQPFIIGLSVNTLEQAKFSNMDPTIDYLGIGPVFPTQSKTDPKPVVGMEFIHTLRKHGITKPLVAIGGIKPENVQPLRDSGADGVAVISAISHAENVPQAVNFLLKGANHAKK